MTRLFALQPPTAYPVPLRVDRSRAPHFGLTNVSSEALRGVTLTLLGSGLLLSAPVEGLLPGQTLRFTLRADNPARNTIVVVRWFRPSGVQYLWRVSF
jgi:hypothetical protein